MPTDPDRPRYGPNSGDVAILFARIPQLDEDELMTIANLAGDEEWRGRSEPLIEEAIERAEEAGMRYELSGAIDFADSAGLAVANRQFASLVSPQSSPRERTANVIPATSGFMAATVAVVTNHLLTEREFDLLYRPMMPVSAAYSRRVARRKSRASRKPTRSEKTKADFAARCYNPAVDNTVSILGTGQGKECHDARALYMLEILTFYYHLAIRVAARFLSDEQVAGFTNDMRQTHVPSAIHRLLDPVTPAAQENYPNTEARLMGVFDHHLDAYWEHELDMDGWGQLVALLSGYLDQIRSHGWSHQHLSHMLGRGIDKLNPEQLFATISTA